jgi:hypothetical protein
MRIEPWQIPVLVTAGTVVLALVVEATAGWSIKRMGRAAILATKRVRTVALALLAILLGIVFVWATLGIETTNLIVQFATLISEALTLWLTYGSYKDQKAAESHPPEAPTPQAQTPEEASRDSA